MTLCNHEEYRTDMRGETAIAVCGHSTPCPFHGKITLELTMVELGTIVDALEDLLQHQEYSEPTLSFTAELVSRLREKWSL